MFSVEAMRTESILSLNNITMNNIKDTHKTVTKQHELAFKASSHVSPVIAESLSRTLADRAQKIVTAVYMVTDLLGEGDPMRQAIRQKAISAMQSLFDSHAADGNKLSLNKAQHDLYEMVSYIDVVYRTGFITEMNYSVLLKVTHALQADIHSELAKLEVSHKTHDRESEIPLDSFFAQSNEKHEPVAKVKDTIMEAPASMVKSDITKSDIVSDVVIKKPAPTQIKATVKTVSYKKAPQEKTSGKAKRHENITAILRQKKNASITDICSLFKDCSSKTIQRDLNELIASGKVVKRGDRRWSTYNLK